jgi:hypothetical protein
LHYTLFEEYKGIIQQIVPCRRDVSVESWAKTAIIQQIVPCRRDGFVESRTKSADIQPIVPCYRDGFVETCLCLPANP